jgi:hypothetical protein
MLDAFVAPRGVATGRAAERDVSKSTSPGLPFRHERFEIAQRGFVRESGVVCMRGKLLAQDQAIRQACVGL